MPNLIFLPEAEKELAEAIDWYESRGKGIGAEFLRSFEASLSAISRNPLQFQAVEGEVRRALLRRFPYSIMYVVAGEDLLILACFHASRNPQRWRERTP